MKNIIYSNYYTSDMETYAIESLLENEVFERKEDISEADIWDEINNINEISWELAEIELKNLFEDKKLLVCGNVGRWNGNFAAGKVIEYDELYKCWRDCDYMEIYDENGHFYIKSSHHDGTNLFEVKILTDKGADYFYKWEYNWNDRRTEQEIHQTLWNNSHYTHIPHFARNVYGCKTR